MYPAIICLSQLLSVIYLTMFILTSVKGMSNHWQFCTDATSGLKNRLTWNAAPVCNKWAVYIGVITWFKFHDPLESYLVDSFWKHWNVSTDRKKRLIGFSCLAGKEGDQWEKPVESVDKL